MLIILPLFGERHSFSSYSSNYSALIIIFFGAYITIYIGSFAVHLRRSLTLRDSSFQ